MFVTTTNGCIFISPYQPKVPLFTIVRRPGDVDCVPDNNTDPRALTATQLQMHDIDQEKNADSEERNCTNR